MQRVLVLVEGQTEEQVVTECLAPYLADRGLWITPTILNTRRTIGGPHHKGGVSNYAQVRGDLAHLLHASHVACVTTLLDYYALPDDFPGMADRLPGDARRRVEHVEDRWAAEVGDRRFVPHLVLHELEAWVYADPARLEPWMFNDDAAVLATLASTAAGYATPEDINERRDTAPSKRLRAAFTAYQKTLHGPLAIAAIGIDRIRAVCPHFDQWLSRLEALATSQKS